MKKINLLFISIFLVMLSSCKLEVEGTTQKVKFQNGTTKVYVFDSLSDIRKSFKAIVKKETGKIKNVDYMQDEFDDLKDTFVFPSKESYDRQQTESYYAYPDFSKVSGDYIARWGTKRHEIASSPVSKMYTESYAVLIYKYDRVNQICSEAIVIDTKIDVMMK